MDRQTVGWQSLVECTGLENRRTLTGPGGSNPSPTAAPNSPLSLAGRIFFCGLRVAGDLPIRVAGYCSPVKLSKSTGYPDSGRGQVSERSAL